MIQESINMKENGYRANDVEIYYSYSELQTRDDTRRSQFLEGLDTTLKDLADGKRVKDLEETPTVALRKHLPVVLRLSYDVPFPDVREHCARIIQELEVGI